MTKLYCISHLIFEFAVVKSQWIIECYTQRKLLPTDSYKVKTFIDNYEERLAHKDAELTKVRKALAEAGPPRKKAVNKLEKTEGPLPSLLGIVDFTALAVQQKQRVAKAIRSKQGYTYRQSGREGSQRIHCLSAGTALLAEAVQGQTPDFGYPQLAQLLRSLEAPARINRCPGCRDWKPRRGIIL